MGFRRGFKTEANRIAIDVRADLGLPAEAPLDPWAVCLRLDVPVIKLSSLVDAGGALIGQHFLDEEPNAFSAVTLPVGMSTVIVHNDRHAPVRQRSNLFHELAHCFLGHPLKAVFRTDGTRARDGDVEDEAAFLGGCLLITNEAACRIVNLGIQATAGRTYGVSTEMMSYRLRVSGANQIAIRRANKRRAS